MLKLVRYTLMTTILLLRTPLFCLLSILRPLKLFQYFFLVYPGTDSDLDNYTPRRIARSALFSGNPSIGGFISTNASGGRGLVLAIPNTIEDFRRNEQLRRKIMRRLTWLSQATGIKAIALAGQLPGAIIKREGILNQPFVKGINGTVFCISETLYTALKQHQLKAAEINIAVVGVGFVGGALINFLKNNGMKVTGIDIEARKSGVSLQHGREIYLQNADVVIVLTPKGSDFLPYIKHLKKDAIIIDDTHPKIREGAQPSGMHLYKVAMGIGSSRFIPGLPGYRANWIPGCALEAMVAAATGDFNPASQAEFNNKALRMGFFAHMVR